MDISNNNNNHSTPSNNKYSLKWNEFFTSMQSQFKLLRESTQFADLKLICEDKTLLCHRLVVAMGSSFIEGVLKTAPPLCCCDNTEIILPEVQSQDLEKILQFLYEGEVNVGEAELASFFQVAKALNIKGLVEENKQESSILVKALLGNNSSSESSRLYDEEDESDFDENDDYQGSLANNTQQSVQSGQTLNNQQPPSSCSSIGRIRATDPRPCPKCGKIYRSAHTLRTHLEDKHTSCPGYRCVLCGTVAKSRNSLHSHMSRQHRGISTKDLPVLPMPAPFDPALAARLLGESNSYLQQNGGGQHHIQAMQGVEHSSLQHGIPGQPPPPPPPGQPNNAPASAGSSSSDGTTGSAILDTYLQFIAENSFARKHQQQQQQQHHHHHQHN